MNKSSQNWHEARHDVFPWFNYFLGTLLGAYKEFEERAAGVKPSRGVKTALIMKAVEDEHGEFSISDIERACPNISRPMVKKVLFHMQKDKKVRCLGKGQSARWERIAH